ncbi:PREDICTED: transcription initiation factor IIB-1-like [Camelina sativa]|uniref:Transcription initiation factor IIB-1-like n=1 Tax=Camelina sativa TaxID=90675 RepID=A0ABM1QHU9_CAMSA|nr:PREDICTED: transcription initiation factor IIB-1-like [Camelina sativa]
MEVITCLDCKKQTNTVIDYQSGDTICTECGLILDSHYIVDYFDRNISHMTSRSSPIRTKLKVGTNGLRIPNPNLVDKAFSTSFRVSSPSCSSHKALLEGHHTRLIEELNVSVAAEVAGPEDQLKLTLYLKF